MRYFPIFLFLCLACLPKQERAAKKLPILPAVDTLTCRFSNHWLIKKGDSTIMLKVCERAERYAYNHLFYKMSEDSIKQWENRGWLLSCAGRINSPIGECIEMNYQLYRNDEGMIISMPSGFYEVIVRAGKQETRQAGALYLFGYKGRAQGTYGGGVYISDTTQQFGWFVIDMPYLPKPPGKVYSERKNPFVFSSHPKAKILCGERPEIRPQELNPAIEQRTIVPYDAERHRKRSGKPIKYEKW